MITLHDKIKQAAEVVRIGGVIAYPTEGVFGLGCDPLNETAVEKLLQIKGRKVNKGLILIADNWSSLQPFIGELPDKIWANIRKPNPHPCTWVLPADKQVPRWLTGGRDTIAVRVTLHPIALALCCEVGHPIVSTSANKSGCPPLTDYADVTHELSSDVDCIVSGEVGDLNKPTEIRNGVTGKVLRR